MANVGERWRTQDARYVYGRTMANIGERRATGLKTTWTNRQTGFFSRPLSQTYLRRTGGICAPESARGRQIRFAGARASKTEGRREAALPALSTRSAYPVVIDIV